MSVAADLERAAWTEEVATWVRAVAEGRPDVTGPDVADAVARALADTVACAVAAGTDPLADVVSRYARGAQAGSAATVWHDGSTLSAEGAALVNAALAHVLDFDDVTPPMRGHPSVALLPALVALAEEDGLTSARLTSAYAAGFEVLCRLARAGVHRQYGLGWHSTAVLGVIAATAGGCVALDLDAATTRHALALAVGQAAGSRVNFATTGKSLQVGFAAAAAVRAVRLASLGATGGPATLESDEGLAGLLGLAPRPERPLGLGVDGVELLSSRIGVKLLPTCYATHAALEAVETILAAHAVEPAEVESVRVTIHRTGTLPLIAEPPADALQAKFSMAFVVAETILHGPVRLTSLERYADADVRSLMERIVVLEDDGPPEPRRAEVVLTTTGGRRFAERVESVAGSAQRPASPERLQRKIADCYGHVGATPPRIDAFIEQWGTLDVRAGLAVLTEHTQGDHR